MLYTEGHIPWITGKHHSEETKRKMSKSAKGRTSWWKGRKRPPFSKEHREKISLGGLGRIPWNKGIPCSEEAKAKIRFAKKGNAPIKKKPSPEETRQKWKEAWERRKARGCTPWNKGLTSETDERVRRSSLKQMGKIVSEETRLKQSIAKRGEKSWNWAGGISRERDLIMSSREYKDWRTTIFKRDDYVCQRCLERGGKLHAHHILPYSICPEEILESENGATLCEGCHKWIHSNELRCIGGDNGAENFC